MIECLSNECWINPQIDFLVLLQNIRTEHFEMFNKFFLSVTILGELWLPILICTIYYWCINSKSGLYLLSLFGLNTMASQFFKMIACVYRPWIISDKVHPVDLAVNYAKGYSFPSGHSATAASVLGGLAYVLRSRKCLCTSLVLLILLVGFSRMWLGVHTPQDVIIGLLTGFVLVFALNSFINWADKNTNRYLYALGIINMLAIMILIYICYFNCYPTDYVNGQLLVNPNSAIYVSIIFYGFDLGLINGGFLCRKYFPFDASAASLKNKIFRGCVGAVLMFLLLKIFVQYLFDNVCDYKFAFAVTFVIGFFITAIYPYIFTRKIFLDIYK